jgi:hypothetical protein
MSEKKCWIGKEEKNFSVYPPQSFWRKLDNKKTVPVSVKRDSAELWPGTFADYSVTRNNMTGTLVQCRTFSATLPIAQRLKPLRPWVLMAMRLTFFAAA